MTRPLSAWMTHSEIVGTMVKTVNIGATLVNTGDIVGTLTVLTDIRGTIAN